MLLERDGDFGKDFARRAFDMERNRRVLLLRRLPGGIAYAFSPSSEHIRYQGVPREVACLEKRGLVLGPAAYALSHRRARQAAASR
jgi:hypothetical protein